MHALSSHPRIDALRTPKNEPAWRTIIVGGRVAARMLASSAETLGLDAGILWAPELAARAAHQAAIDRCRVHAVGLLGPKALSRQELAHRLASRGHRHEIVTEVIERLASEGLIDDRALAQAILDASDQHRPAGAALLRERLLKRGVPEPLVTELLGDRHEHPLAQALQALDDTARPADAELPPLARARRYFSRLARRGFDEDTARRAVAQRVPEAGELDA
jgi:regulatory protein